MKKKGLNFIKKGNFGEEIAKNFLIKNNYIICRMNYYCRYGEIDIIAENRSYLCFVEVKTRSSFNFALPVEFVNYRKREKLIKTAVDFLNSNPSLLQPRFDVIEVLILNYIKNKVELRHIKNAFYKESFY
ncbi:MAG: YraN family protein [Oscillospiraceae bacterium]|jgi:putative endonuclease|nr:YraN family protein [Oscillospiraceae bacterium]